MNTDRSKCTGMLALAALLVLAAAAPGCNKTDPTAPSTWTLNVTAAPSTLDLSWDATTQTSENRTCAITAMIYDSGGVPQPDFTVNFSVAADSHYFIAQLQSNGQAMKSDQHGLVKDVLDVAWAADMTGDPTSTGAGRTLTVTATSGLLTKDVTVTVRAVAAAAR